MQDNQIEQQQVYMEDSLENINENKLEDVDELDKQQLLSENVYSIVNEQIGNRLKIIAERQDQQQQSIEKYQDMLNSLLNTAERVLSNLEKANEQAAVIKSTQNAAPQISGSTIKKAGQGSMISSLMGISTGLPVINEAVHISSRLTASVNQLPAQANLSKIAKGTAVEARSQRGSRVVKDNIDDESTKAKTIAEKKESNKEQLHAIEEGTNVGTHRVTASSHNAETPKNPKISDLKTQRNLSKNKSMIQLKQEETKEPTKTEKSRFADKDKAGPSTEVRKGSTVKKEDNTIKGKQEEEDKPKIEKKPAVPKAGVNHEKLGSDEKAKEKHLKSSSSVSQFHNATETKISKIEKSTHSTTAGSRGKSTTGVIKKENSSAVNNLDSSHAKIIPRKQKEEKTETHKVEDPKEGKKLSEQPSEQELEKKSIAESESQTNKIEFNDNQEQEKLIIVSQKDILKQDEDENLLDDIDHSEQTKDKSIDINTNINEEVAQKDIPIPQQPNNQVFDANVLKQLIKDFIEGKVPAETIAKFCIDNAIHNETIDETLIFEQIDLQKIVDEFNANNPDASDFSETFQLQSSTKDGLSLMEINFMQEMMDKEEIDESVLTMFELLYVLMDGTEIEQYRKAENKENYVRNYMNDNYDKFVNIAFGLETKIDKLNKNYEVKKFIKEFIEKHEFLLDQDYYFVIEPLCALLTPAIEEIIYFMGLKENSTNKKNVIFFNYQENQIKAKRINELNQIIVNNTYNQNNDE